MKENGRPRDQDAPYEDVRLSFERFEWDEDKRESNIVRHGIDFRFAAKIFDGPVLRKRSDRKGEVRWLAVGIHNDEVISVIYTQRNESCRIISRAAYRQLFARGA